MLGAGKAGMMMREKGRMRLSQARWSHPTSRPVIVRMFSGYAVLLSFSDAPMRRQIPRG